MKKKTKTKAHYRRNAAPAARPAPATARAPRPRTAHEEETPLRRLAYTAAGAAGTALLGSFLAKEGWAPKTIAGAISAVGAGLAWKGEDATIRSVGSGAMSAAGSQLALMLIDDHDQKAPEPTAKKPANADEVPPGSLENAFERARLRLSVADGDSA